MHTTPDKWFESIPIAVPDALSQRIERILDGEPASFSFMIPGYAPRVEPCVFCGRLTQLVVLASDRDFMANVTVDQEDLALWVDVASPHSCPEAKRHQELLDADLEEPTD
jgi:hypothetical protein